MAILSPACEPNQSLRVSSSRHRASVDPAGHSSLNSQSSPTGRAESSVKRERVAHAARLHPVNRGQTRANNFRRDEECDAIHNSSAQRRSGEMRAAFDQHAAPSAMPKLEHQAIELDHSAMRRDGDHFDAAALESRSRASEIRRRGHQDGDRARALPVHARRRRRAQIARRRRRAPDRGRRRLDTSGADRRRSRCPRRP